MYSNTKDIFSGNGRTKTKCSNLERHPGGRRSPVSRDPAISPASVGKLRVTGIDMILKEHWSGDPFVRSEETPVNPEMGWL